MVMKTDIKRWAVKELGGSKENRALARDIRADIKHAYRLGRTTKSTKLWEELFRQFRGFKNLPSGLNSLHVGDRVTTEEMKSCWLCGEPHGTGYSAPPTLNPISGRQPFIGKDCAKKLTGYGLRAGVITAADRRARITVTRKDIDGLDDLIIEAGPAVSIAFESTPYSATDRGLLGNMTTWLSRQDNLGADLEAALGRVVDSYADSSRGDRKMVFDAIAERKPFPKDTYKHVVEDLKEMEREGKAPEGIAKKLMLSTTGGRLTCAKVLGVLDGVDQQGYRIKKNQKRLKIYGVATPGAIMNDLARLIRHDKPLWGEDMVRMRFTYNKVLSEGDYRLVAGCFNKWRFGYTSEVHGANALRLRNRAVRLESVVNFRKKIDGLIAVHRKMEYALHHAESHEYKVLGDVRKALEKVPKKKQSKVFREACNEAYQKQKDPLVLIRGAAVTTEGFGDHVSDRFKEDNDNTSFEAVIDMIGTKIVTNDRPTREFQASVLPRVQTHAEYGFVLKSDIKKLETAYRRRKAMIQL